MEIIYVILAALALSLVSVAIMLYVSMKMGYVKRKTKAKPIQSAMPEVSIPYHGMDKTWSLGNMQGLDKIVRKEED